MLIPGDATLADPFGDGVDYALMYASGPGAAATFIYLPHTGQPGLSVDLMRFDQMPRQALSPKEIALQTTRAYAAVAPAAATSCILHTTLGEALFEYGMKDDALQGSFSCIGRYVRAADGDFAVQVIRKIRTLSAAERASRIRFLLESVDPARWQRFGRGRFSESAREAQRSGERLARVAAQMLQSGAADLSTAELGDLLARASPYHDSGQWWLLARFVAQNRLLDGSTDEFAASIALLELALVALSDLGSEAFIEAKRIDTAMLLGKVLMLTGSSNYLEYVARAGHLFHAVAAYRRDGQPFAQWLAAEAMDQLTKLIARRDDDQAALDGDLSVPARQALLNESTLEPVIQELLQYSRQAAYVARHGTPAMFRSAVLAADLAHILWAQLPVYNSFTDYYGQSIVINDAQIQSQRLMHCVTEEDQRDLITQLPDVFSQHDNSRPRLVYLRSLSSSKRLILRNRFAWLPRIAADHVRLALTSLSLESALHLAFLRQLDTFALGGMPDFFGMRRAAVGQSGEPQAWREFASIMIRDAAVLVVLAGESEGLQWELSEIRRQGALDKILLVIPPVADARQSVMAEALSRVAGLQVQSEDLAPGFVLFTVTGQIECQLSFDSLWNGRLRDVVERRLLNSKPAVAAT
ncbi:MAG: hypothetical protein ABI831_12590 [Betaproteobacteria bacterium]